MPDQDQVLLLEAAHLVTNLLMVIIQINEGEDIQQLTFYCQQKMLILIGWFS